MTKLRQDSIEDEAGAIALSGHCVAFIGSGLSSPPGNAWKETVEKIASHCGVKTDGGESLPDIIDGCQNTKPEEYRKIFREIFPMHVATSRTALNYVLRLPFKSYITTNFDPWLRNFSETEHIEATYVYPDIPMNKGLSKNLYYIHGFYESTDQNCDPQSLVFGKHSFDVAYGPESLLPGFLLHLFVYEHILFIGFDPLEKNISNLIARAENIRSILNKPGITIERTKKFALWPTKPENQSQGEYDAIVGRIMNLGIQIIIYERKGDDYRGLEELLYNWIGYGKRENRPAPFKTGFDL